MSWGLPSEGGSENRYNRPMEDLIKKVENYGFKYNK
jgi:hypothetical protein